MGIGRNFRTTGENIIASYNAIDVAQGRGLLLLYGGDYYVNGVQTFMMSSNPFYAKTGVKAVANATHFTENFDAVFNRPLTIQGDYVINSAIKSINGATYNGTATIQKISNGVTTTIGSATQSFAAPAGAEYYLVYAYKGTITNPVTFKKGDTIRLTLDQYGSGSGTTYYFFDPKNRSNLEGTEYTGIQTSQILFELPVRISL